MFGKFWQAFLVEFYPDRAWETMKASGKAWALSQRKSYLANFPNIPN